MIKTKYENELNIWEYRIYEKNQPHNIIDT